MAYPLRQSTAVTVLIGSCLLASDGNTEYTTAIPYTAIFLHKYNTATIAAKGDTTSSTHRVAGVHTVPLSATDTNTLGAMSIITHVATVLPTKLDCEVLTAAAYDALYGAGVLPVNMTQVSGAAVSATTAQIGTNVVNWKGAAAPAMTGDAFARIGAPTGSSLAADLVLKSTQVSNDSIYTRLGVPSGASLAAVLLGIIVGSV